MIHGTPREYKNNQHYGERWQGQVRTTPNNDPKRTNRIKKITKYFKHTPKKSKGYPTNTLSCARS